MSQPKQCEICGSSIEAGLVCDRCRDRQMTNQSTTEIAYRDLVFRVRDILYCGHVENVVYAVGRLNTKYNDALARIATLERQLEGKLRVHVGERLHNHGAEVGGRPMMFKAWLASDLAVYGLGSSPESAICELVYTHVVYFPGGRESVLAEYVGLVSH